MHATLSQIKSLVFDPFGFHFSEFKKEPESQEYEACEFLLNDCKIICRTSKITPKKQGQFVTFWKRQNNGPIEPFSITDSLDFYLVIIQDMEQAGLFVFPKAILLKKGILSSPGKEGKRAFRVYPPWVNTQNPQAVKTQTWQSDYFLLLGPEGECDRITVKRLFMMA